ncbi:MAG: NAD(P)/FAD-dependent oxidoreductase [bacterium]|jgi:sarcosine oxidase subunit beta|nr:FAD-binding oxidoreductase [Betaproteobacteria bacterium]
MLTRADVVVVGGGVVGCAVAYYLSKAGARVALVERSVVGSGASSVNPGSIAMATKKGGTVLELARASQRLHEGLSAELGTATEYAVEGNLIVAESETEIAYLEELAAGQRAVGVPVELVDEQRCRELNPLLRGRVLSGLYCATDAHANPFKVTQGFADAARNRGAQLFTGTAVEGISVEAGHVTGLMTSRGNIEAPWVVNAAGAFAPMIGKMVGATHDVVPRRGQIVVLEATDALPGIRVSGASQLLAKHVTAPADGRPHRTPISLSYTRKPLSGTVLLGSTNEFVGYDSRNTREVVTGICECAARFMPELGRLNVLRSWAGLRPYSSKGPLLGDGGGPAGYAVATGHGGDGMALSPVTGLYLSRYVGRDGKSYPVAQFLQDLKADSGAVQ